MRCLSTYTGIGLRNTLCDHLLVAFLVTGVPTILALITDGIEQELVAKGAKNDLVKLSLDKFVSVHFVHLVLSLANSALTTKPGGIQRAFSDILFDYDTRILVWSMNDRQIYTKIET